MRDERSAFLWGSIWFGGREFSNNNRFVIGISGSGKTLTIRTVMASLLPWPKSKPKPHDSGHHQLRLVDAADLTPHHKSRVGVYQPLVYDAKTKCWNIRCGRPTPRFRVE